MSILGHPNIDKAARIFNQTVIKMKDSELLLNYIILDVDFEYKEHTKYPGIPCRVDDNVDIYPLKGTSIITGCEYVVAKSMGCKLYVKDGILIPFKRYSESELKSYFKKGDIALKNKVIKKSSNLIGYKAPFRNIISDLQSKRKKYPKKTFYNYMYKEIGNSIYGQVAMGISGKNHFDVKSQGFVKVEGGLLSNPILSSYITGFTRALISECMHNIQSLGGNIVSVTTDGFITDVTDLENKLIKLDKEKINCLNIYKEIRKILTVSSTTENDEINYEYDDRALEIKTEEYLGLIS
ncbi:hypothetical protein GGS24DRAFT_426456 [Hypoxylon argillaceum]|nr:hypothetical protein GGS24DRAFT_426456 [Hypoxylon argillaceum]